MRVNHLIIGASNIKKSTKFYCNLFNFSSAGKFIDTGTGSEGEILNFTKDNQFLQLLIVPFKIERLPNPQHVAFEVDKENFSSIYDKAISLKIKVRKNPAMNDNESGIGVLNTVLCNYNVFYIADPSNVNIEIMCMQ